MSALLLLTHTLTHNRKSAGGWGGLFSKSNRYFPSHAAPIGLEITPFPLPRHFGTKRPCVQVTSLRPPVNPHEHCVCAGSFHALKRCLNCVLVFIWSLPLRKHTKRYLQKRERAACVHLSHTRSRISVRGRNRLPVLYPGNLFDTGIAGRLPEAMGGW